MSPLREQIYEEICQNNSITLEQLAKQYRVSEPVMELQLNRLKQEGKKIKVSDEEVCLLLDHTNKFLPLVFWIVIGFIFTLAVMLGVES